MTTLTKPEKRYLKALAKLEQQQKDFTHRAIADALGYKSVARSFQLMSSLEAKGYVRAGVRLVLRPSPVRTHLGIEALAA